MDVTGLLKVPARKLSTQIVSQVGDAVESRRIGDVQDIVPFLLNPERQSRHRESGATQPVQHDDRVAARPR
jgi:hypothetical protein